jgi:hypothetical protein
MRNYYISILLLFLGAALGGCRPTLSMQQRKIEIIPEQYGSKATHNVQAGALTVTLHMKLRGRVTLIRRSNAWPTRVFIQMPRGPEILKSGYHKVWPGGERWWHTNDRGFWEIGDGPALIMNGPNTVFTTFQLNSGEMIRFEVSPIVLCLKPERKNGVRPKSKIPSKNPCF